MRRTRLLTAVVVTAALALSACGSGGDTKTEGKTQLKLYNDKGAWSPYFKEIGTLSQQQIGLGMEPVGYTDANTYDAFIKASFRTNVKPDLFTWHTGAQLAEIVKAGQVADTSSLWSDAVGKGYLPESLKQYYTFDGKQYCVPLNVAYWVMFYNKKVFDDAGLQPPKTWADMMDAAVKLKAKGVTPFYGTSQLFSFVWFQQLLIGQDPQLYNDLGTGKAKFTDPGVVKVMEQWKSLIDSGYMSDPGDKTEPQELLKSGKVAMAPFGTWFNTSMTQVGLKPGTDYGMFTIPNLNPANTKNTLLFESGPLCVLDKAPDKAASLKFAQWWLEPAAQEKWATSRGDVSANPKVTIPDPALNAINQSAGGSDVALASRFFELVPAPVLTAALDAFGAFTVKPADYQKQLATLQKAADDYWAKAGK
ncbi:ABC-type glycerol-3-phosphate transport system substrate-binding protein [Hamadaea flava]|uniref:ABC transporter substrate-binding protein n=1 Tax=Hamadaea flava TaxID=1742688 RepID=A0ABV8LKC1_9ACTN|nr:extracellular solute-binding protein [Hamadaea flava]MCP2325121.1 ABC-type glycerol-3-phosphate transport system substrate-binding protein [Hamadaea flava]